MTQTEEALVSRACAVFGLSRPASVDPDMGLFSWEGFASGGMIDSLAVVEFFMAVGDEVDLPLLDLLDESDIQTLGKLGEVIDQRAAPGYLEQFRERWGGVS